MNQNCLELFTESDLDQLADAVLAPLARAGAMYQSDAILDALEAVGAMVDR
jgi:hypothetical protein